MTTEKMQADLRLLAIAFYRSLQYDGSCEYGSIGIDCKRPFGTSDVEGDICEIIGMTVDEDDGSFTPEQREYATNLYQVELPKYLRREGLAHFGVEEKR